MMQKSDLIYRSDLSYRQWLALLALLWLLLAPALSQANELSQKADHPATQTLLVLGDSLSAAYNLPAASGWVSLLSERLAQKAPQWQVVNASISGETTRGGLTRLPQLLRQHQPQIVLLELGGNDGLRGLPPRLIQTNLQQMIKQSQAAGAEVLLVGILLPPNYGAVYVERFAAIFPELARTHAVPLVPFLLEGVADQPQLMQDDQIHPTAAAQPKLLETVWVELAPLLD